MSSLLQKTQERELFIPLFDDLKRSIAASALLPLEQQKKESQVKWS